jgi:hypothetical protein
MALVWFHWAVHFQAHVLMALYTEGQDAEMMFRFDCYDAAGTLLDNHDCPLESESEVMARLRRTYADVPRLAAAAIDRPTSVAVAARTETMHASCSALAEVQP